MSEGAARAVVVAHGSMAEGLVDAARSITGAEDGVLVAISNRGLSPAALAERVRAELGTGNGIVFSDLPSGSCGFAARLLARELPSVVVICGVNLPMLLDFVTHRELPMAELADRLVTKGRASIASSNAPAHTHGDSSVPR